MLFNYFPLPSRKGVDKGGAAVTLCPCSTPQILDYYGPEALADPVRLSCCLDVVEPPDGQGFWTALREGKDAKLKKGTSRHPKMLKLARELGINRHEARGIMGDFWEWAGEYATSGDVGKYSNSDIADGIGYEGDQEKLIQALIDCHWVDIDKKHRLVVHDWDQHCETWVRKRLSRQGIEILSGQCPDSGQTASSKRRTAATKGAKYGEGKGREGKGRGESEGGSKKTPIGWDSKDGWNNISQSHRKEWSKSFPAVDISMELKQMDSWLRGNPRKAVKSNWERFIVNWMTKSQDSGGGLVSNKPAQKETLGPIGMFK